MSHNTVSGNLVQLSTEIVSLSGVAVINGTVPIPVDGQPTRLILPTFNTANVFGSSMRGQRARGTSGTPETVEAGDVLLQIVGDGYQGSDFASGKASMAFFAAEQWTPTANGTYIRLRTTPIGGTGALSRVYVGSDGEVGINTDAPNYHLDVNGSGNFASGLYINGVPVGTGAGQSPEATGSLLYMLVTGMSGQAAIDYATKTMLEMTGQTLNAKIDTLSGYVMAASGGLEIRIAQTGSAAVAYANGIGINVSGVVVQTGTNAIAYTNTVGTQISGTIAATGQALYALVADISGQGTGYATKPELTTTGQILDNRITSLSGYVGLVSGGLETRIAQSGSAAVMHANGIGSNLSGALTLTGQTLQGRIDSVSGYVGLASGGLETRIAQSGNAAVGHANDIGTNLSGNLILTGSNLYAVVTGMSGQLVVDYATKTQLTQTGQVLQGRIDSVSGWVGLVSGGLEVRIAQGDAASVAYANGMGSILSGNMTQTGAVLNAKINMLSGYVGFVSGGLEARIAQGDAASVAYANTIGVNTSGSLTASGQTLGGQINSLSGYVIGASGALQAQISAGNGTQVQVTGSTTLGIANFTGLGGTLVFSSGGQVFVSGGAGGGGVPSVNGITSAVTVLGTGGLSVTVQGSNVLVSGDPSISGALTQTGVALGAKIDVLSGFVGQVSGGLETRIVQSGTAAVTYSNGMGSILSGNLTQTGATLGAKIDSVSGFVTLASGGLETRIAQSGVAGVSYANGVGANLSGNLQSTGSNIYGFIVGFSGQTAIDYATKAYTDAMGNIISGNLTITGQTLGVRITSLSGFVGLASGGLETRLTQSGAATIAYSNSVGSILSGQLTLSGQTLFNRDAAISGGLEARIASSGAAAVSYANSVGASASGTIAQTGAANIAFTLGASGALQSQISAGGSQVRVSGSSSISIADFSGIEGIAVVYSGSQVLISGSAGGPGGGVPSVNGITDAVTIAGSGGTAVSTVGNTVYVSSPQLPMVVNFTAGAVTATNMPAALAFFANSAAYITYADLSRFTGVALYINKTATAGAAASRLFLRYRSSYNATATNWTNDISSPVMQFPINVTNTFLTSGFYPLADEAKSGVYLALMGTGGDGVLDPAFGIITAQFM